MAEEPAFEQLVGQAPTVDRFVSRGSWAEFFNLSLGCTTDEEPPPPPPGDCETAFAIGEQCFLAHAVVCGPFAD